MPIVNLAQPILALDNTPCREQTKVPGPDGTLEDHSEDLLMSTMCINVLSVLDEQETKNAAQDGHAGGRLKLERFLLKQRIHNAGPEGVQLAPKEIALLQELLGRYASDLVVGRIYAVLDPEQTHAAAVTPSTNGAAPRHAKPARRR